MSRTPTSLLERLKRPQDHEAWARFVRLYAPMIYRWASAAGLEANDAADLTQEVFVTLIRVLPEFLYNPKRSFRAWLKTVTLNRWRDMARCRGNWRRHSHIEDLADAGAGDPSVVFEEAEHRRYLASRVMELARREFEAITWQVWWEYVVMERSAADVASEFGVTVNSVYLTKSRVLRRLREELKGLWG